MPLPEGYRPRKGDILVLHGVCRHDVDANEKSVFVDVEGHYGALMVKLRDIDGIFARCWYPGDKVRSIDRSDGGFDGEVVATCGVSVWAKWSLSGSMETFGANELELIPDAPSEPEGPPAEQTAPPVHLPETWDEPPAPATPFTGDEEMPL
jgi:hypothetical protein